MTTPKNNMQTILIFLFKWKAPSITLDLLCNKTGIERKPALRILQKLEKEQLLRLQSVATKPLPYAQGGRRKKNPKWILVCRVEYENRFRETSKDGPQRDKIWKLMRIRRTFTTPELSVIAGINIDTVRDYLKILEKNEVVKRLKRNGAGVVFQLVKDTGPKRPILEEIKKEKN